jgi:phosphoribosylanthranilate isomerase
MRVATLRNARTRIKFCGITSPEDVAIAVDAGADAVGIIVAESERRVSLERAAEIAQAVPPFVTGVGVIGDDDCDAPALQALGLTLQFAGPAAPARCARLSGGMLYVKVFAGPVLPFPGTSLPRWRANARSSWRAGSHPKTSAPACCASARTA